jgi:tRNA threonylcarbamoyladenosine modification (KEOPS) complex Cgi121 subunit
MAESAEPRASLKIAPGVHTELSTLADDYRFSISEFADVLLEYAMRDLARVDEALDERKREGSLKAHRRRSPEQPTKLRPASG